MPPSRKRHVYHPRTLRQQRLSTLHSQQPLTRQQQQQQQDEGGEQEQQQQQQQQQDKQMSCQNCNALSNLNARAENKVSIDAETALIKQETQSNSLELNDIKDAVHKDIQEMLEGDLYCAICREIYINPLILNCAHSFCRYCLNNWLSKQVGCPSCRMVVVFQTENLALKNIVNKMVQTSSPGFQEERQLSLDQRSKAELSQDQGRVQPLMERRSFLPNGKVRHSCPSDRLRVIRPWRGPNGATIWRTKLDISDQVIRPEVGDSGHTDVSSDDDDGDYDDVHDDDDDSYDDGPEFEPNQSDLEDTESDDDPDDNEDIDDDPEFDVSGSSEIDVDSDESLASSRDRRINDLSILAGIVAPDDDEDYEIEIEEGDSSSNDDDDSSMDDGNVFDAFGLFSRGRASDTSSEEEDEDVNSDVELEPDMMNDISDSSESSTEEEEEEEEEDEEDEVEDDEDSTESDEGDF